MSDGRDEVKDEGLKNVAEDERCNRVMKDRAKGMEGEMESTEPQ
jgi:hypothetical protein